MTPLETSWSIVAAFAVGVVFGMLVLLACISQSRKLWSQYANQPR